MPERDSLRRALPAGLDVVAVIPTTSASAARLFRCVDRARGLELVLKLGRGTAAESVRTEARVLARLGGHPHVIRLHTVGRTNEGVPWLLTDHASGGAIAGRIGAPAADALAWAAQLAEALAHAHAMGVVHGDVTPTNVLLDEHERVLLADFGSAHATTDGAGSRRHYGHTPTHAAPERRRLAPPTAASDVYGLASTVLTVCGDHHGMGRNARNLLHRCLGDPQRRPCAEALARQLSS